MALITLDEVLSAFGDRYLVSEKFALSVALVISVFSIDSSICSFSARNAFTSMRICSASCLEPITPIRKSSAYRQYWIRLYFSSMGSMDGSDDHASNRRAISAVRSSRSCSV